MESFAANLQRLRRDHGVTQEEFAEIVGLSVRYVSRLESGEVDVGIRLLARLGSRLGVRIAQLLRPARLPPAKTGRPRSTTR
jgi:transcriptional regulator with XRE-family HTH domain